MSGLETAHKPACAVCCLYFVQVQCLCFWNYFLHLTRMFASKRSGLSATLLVQS